MMTNTELIEALASSRLPDDEYADAIETVRALIVSRDLGKALLTAVLEHHEHLPAEIILRASDLWGALELSALAHITLEEADGTAEGSRAG